MSVISMACAPFLSNTLPVARTCSPTKGFSAFCPVSGMDSVTGTYTEPSLLKMPKGEPAFSHIVMQSLL